MIIEMINGHEHKELESNEYVVFVIDGKEYKAGVLEVVWSGKNKAFYVIDDNGHRVYSNDVRQKAPKRKHAKATNVPTVEITNDIMTQTEKAYGVFDGTNNAVVKGNVKVYYKWIAKSVCEEKDGRIYAPIWAVR